MPAASAAPPRTARQDASLIGLVGVSHSISHFSQLLLAPLFPWLKDAFHVGYAELGLLMTIFFVVSCVVQTLSGFVVDRFGARPVLFGGLALLGLAAFGYAASPSNASPPNSTGLAPKRSTTKPESVCTMQETTKKIVIRSPSSA